MRCKKPLPFLALALSLAIPLSAHATQFGRWENRRETSKTFRLIPEIHFISTSENYDANGDSAAVTGLDYSKRLYDLNLVYGLNPRASAFVRLSFANVSYKTPTLNASGFGLGDQAFGFNYRVYESDAPSENRAHRRTSVDTQVQFDVPFYDKAAARRKTPKDPLLGEGTFDFTIGPFVTVPLNQGPGMRHFLIGTLGLKVRNEGFSSAIPYQIYLSSVAERTGWVGRLGLAGMKSVSSDNGATQTDSGAQVQDSGGSLIVDALNSSYLSVKGAAGYQFDPANQVFLGAEKTLAGTSTANLFAVFVGAQFRFGDGSAKERAGESVKSSGQYDLEAFVSQTNDRLNIVKIDRGENDGIAQGQSFDIYGPASEGGGRDPIARAVVTDVKANEAVLAVKQYMKQVVIQAGFSARRLVR